MPWIAVERRFMNFAEELLLTKDQLDDGVIKQLGVRQSLQRAYYGLRTDDPPGMLVGSWGRTTQVRPSSDIDVLFVLPASEKARFDNYSGNGQSALLQEVKSVLQQTYPATDMRGDGQVVQVKFNSIMVEILPAFRSSENYTFHFPDTHNGGSWKASHPEFEQASFTVIDQDSAGNFRKVIRMMKCWKRHCNIEIKSFILEHIIYEFFRQYDLKRKSFFWYDWIIRDFFGFLISMMNRQVWIPNDTAYVSVGDEWGNKANVAYGDAIEACRLEYEDLSVSAGLAWQRLFGPRIEAAL